MGDLQRPSGDSVMKPRSDLRSQKVMALAEYQGIIAAVRDPRCDFPSGETAMLVSNHGELFELNLVAAFVWELIGTGRTFDEVINAIIDVFDVQEEVAREEVAQLFSDWSRLGLATPGSMRP